MPRRQVLRTAVGEVDVGTGTGVDVDVDVAVIIVTYKSAELTIDCLHSVARERERPGVLVRVVVVDNASGDTPAIARAVVANGWSAWVKVTTAERNGGFAYGNNLGARVACADTQPDFLHLLNPDTVLLPGALHALVDFLKGHPDAGVVGGVFENADQSEWAIAFRFPTVLGEIEQQLEWSAASKLLRRWRVPMHMGTAAQAVDWVSGASMMVRRSVFDAVGGMDEGFFLYFEETEFCFRVKAAGHAVWYAPQSRVVHIAGQSTKVTERNAAPRRLPAYWFASRRRYFRLTHGTAYAVCADLAAVGAGWIGALKRRLLFRRSTQAPGFLRDTLRHSLLWRSNRQAEPAPRVANRL